MATTSSGSSTPGTLADMLDGQQQGEEEHLGTEGAEVGTPDPDGAEDDQAARHDGSLGDDEHAEGGQEEQETANSREARYRVAAREARERAEAAEARLAAVQADRVAELATRAGLVDGTLLLAEGVELGDLLDDRGAPDPDRVAEAVKSLTAARPYLDRANVRDRHEFGQGSRQGSGPSGPTWAGLLSGGRTK